MTPHQNATESPKDVLKAEVFIETYQIIAEWIRFADAKAAVTLTVNGVLLGLLVPTLKTYLADSITARPTAWWPTVVVFLFVAWLILLSASAIWSFLCILPFRGPARKLAFDRATHFHPAAVARSFVLDDPQKFVNDCCTMSAADLQREVVTAILIDSHLSNSKYRYVTRSIQCLAGSVILGFFYLLAIQF